MEGSFGEYLRKERETREISIDDVAKATKIQKRLLIALEENRLDQLPSRAFVRGFIRLYAQKVGLDPGQAVLRFEEYLKKIHPELSGEKPQAKPPVRVWNIILPVAIVLVVVAVVALSVLGNRGSEVQNQPPAGPISGVNPVKPPGTGGQPGAEGKVISPPYLVKVKAIEICWLLATIDEKTSREATLYPGDSIEIRAEQRLSLLLGNSGGAQVMVNSAGLGSAGGHWKPARILIPEDLEKYLPQGFKLKTESGQKTEAEVKPRAEKPAETRTAPQPAEQKASTAAPAQQPANPAPKKVQ